MRTRPNYITVSSGDLGDLVTTTISYDYDPLYRLTSAAYSSGEVYTYTYDAVGNRLAMGAGGEVSTYTYDPANRLTSVDGVGYTWDDNGNLLDDGARTYDYDYANRLIAVVSGTLTTTYIYNGDGYRVAKTENGETTTYAVAVLGLSQVLIETTAGDSILYLYGHDLLAEEDDTWKWHLGDGLGSVRQLIDSGGGVSLAQGYTPFGVPLWSEGGGTTGYGFTGERWEAYAELLFLRARYYGPGTGRFVSKDLWKGDLWHPLTQNQYLYSVDNPVNLRDPSGSKPRRGCTYSCNCGFIDDSHFDKTEGSFAAEVIRKVRETESGGSFHLELPNGVPLPWGEPLILQNVKVDVLIKASLSDKEEKEVALGIFQAVENASEEGWAQRLSGSSYSEEDLTSNLLSFYLAVGGRYTMQNIERWCGYLTTQQSIEVYDWYKEYVGFEKVKEWGEPRLATCAEAECGFWLWKHPCPQEQCPLNEYCPEQRKFPCDKFDIMAEHAGDKWEFEKAP